MSRNYKYPKQILDYIKARLETQPNKTTIAKEVIKSFGVTDSVEITRKIVSNYAKKLGVKARTKSIKRLFFDIETSYCIGWFWQPSWKTSIQPHQIIQDKKIICISYKWQDEDKVHTLKWDKDQNDKEILRKFSAIMGEADEIVGHNGDNFDIKEFRTRCIKEGILMFPKYRTTDTLKKARQYFRFPSNKLDEIGRFLNIGRKIHTDYSLWDNVIQRKCKKALKKMCEYCEQDVLLLEEIFYAFTPYILHNTNFAVKLGGEKYHCPECASKKTEFSHTDTTPSGWIKRHFKCKECKKYYHVSNKTYFKYLKDEYNNG